MKLLRQSTISIIQVGPIVGTDFLTVQTGLVLATAHAELFQAGATVSIDISARTWAHIAGGVYQLTLSAADLALAGPLLINLHIASSTPLAVHGNVLVAQAYDALMAGGFMYSDVKAVFASANAASQLANGANASATITVGNGATTTVIPTGLSSAISNFWTGRTVVFLTGALSGQACSITGYNGVTKSLTVSALTSAPSAGDTGIIV